MELLCLKGLPAPIAVGAGVADLADHLRMVLVGWPFVPAEVLPSRSPFLTATGTPQRVVLRQEATGIEIEEPSPVSALCTIVVELMAEYVRAQRSLGNLHAAAVEIGGRLVVFPATNRAGKSTLVGAFAARGRRVFADDLLPVDLDAAEAAASGCLPRLRLPLPRSAPQELVDCLAAKTVLSDGYYAYLRAGDHVVPHGARAPIGAVVILDRREEMQAAALEPLTPDETLLRLLLQDTKQDHDAGWALDRYLALIENARMFKLRYADIGAALDCLESAFATWPDIAAASSEGENPDAEPTAEAPLTPSAGRRGYRRADHVTARRVGEAAFLVDRKQNEIHHLNPLGLGLWNLLEEPSDEEHLLGIFHGAFPETPRETVAADLQALIGRFLEAGLIERAG